MSDCLMWLCFINHGYGMLNDGECWPVSENMWSEKKK